MALTPDRNQAQPYDPQVFLELNRVLHEPGRLAIMALLTRCDSADFTTVMRDTGLTRGNLSTHMTRLESAGYVFVRKDFVDRVPRTLLVISPDGRRALAAYRRSLEIVLSALP